MRYEGGLTGVPAGDQDESEYAPPGLSNKPIQTLARKLARSNLIR